LSETTADLARRLRRTDLLLLRAVRRQRSRPAVRAKGQFWGQVITDDEVDALLRAHGEIDWPAGTDGLDDAIAASAAWRDAPGGRLGRVREAFDLDGDAVDLLLLALAPELSTGYARIFAYLNDNLHQAFLTVDLATRILRQDRKARLALAARLLPAAPLLANRLLLIHPADGVDPLSGRRLHLAPRFVHWLVGDALGAMEGTRSMDVDRAPFVPSDVHARVAQIAPALGGGVTVVVTGGNAPARDGVAITLARALGRPLLRIDLERARALLAQPSDLARELVLDGALALFTNVPDSAAEPTTRNLVSALSSALASLPIPFAVGTADRRTASLLLESGRPEVTLPAGRSSLQERSTAWTEAFARRGWDPSPAADLASRFTGVAGTGLDAVLDRAVAESGGREPDRPALWAAARDATRPEMAGLAVRLSPRHRWEDLILPDRILQQLRHLERVLAQQERVMIHWGGERVRPRGYGLKVLFSGAPGTGKTMCAEVIAGSLGLDLFKVDLSSVVSRWVGETEKNLRGIFDAAEGGHAVVLFDEADALFGSRGDVNEAQDRFANQEVSYLLQRLETFEGTAVLTTNLQENIDEAFLRRFTAVVEFPMPGPAERLLLWERAIPPGAPRSDDLDLAGLAARFQLAGGAIVNAAVNAAVQAAAEDAPLNMEHAVTAVARELYKMGRQVNRVHFGEYFDRVASLFG
jgi:hypothetical protein